MSAMTDKTKAALLLATQAVSNARANVDREVKAVLAEIAANLPERAAEAAKRVATAQPEVTKSLGKEGVAAMRSELDAAAEELGRQFIAAEDEIEWPLGTTYTKVEKHHVHGALFKRFYKKTGALSQVLTAHGYRLGDSEPFLPQSLYTESKFTQLAAALTALGLAEEKLQSAKKSDDDAAVNDLWD